jgi:hypothetical protein
MYIIIYIFRHVRRTAKSDYQLRHLSVCLSVFPQGATDLPLGVFSWNVIFQCFLKICWENSSFIKIWQERRVLYMNYVNEWSALLRGRYLHNIQKNWFCNVLVYVCVGSVMCGCICVGFVMCGYFDNCVGVLVICVLVFIEFCIVCTVLLYCSNYVY